MRRVLWSQVLLLVCSLIWFFTLYVGIKQWTFFPTGFMGGLAWGLSAFMVPAIPLAMVLREEEQRRRDRVEADRG